MTIHSSFNDNLTSPFLNIQENLLILESDIQELLDTFKIYAEPEYYAGSFSHGGTTKCCASGTCDIHGF